MIILVLRRPPLRLITMAFVHYMVAAPAQSSLKPLHNSNSNSSIAPISSLFWSKTCKIPRLVSETFSRAGRRHAQKAKAKLPESEAISGVDAFTQFKHVLLPITDKNPYLSEGTRQATATAAALAKKYKADLTVVVIDENPKESLPEHDTKLSSIRWHLSEGGFQEFGLLEKLGEGKKPTAIIGEVADDLNLDLVVISMEAIHSKQVDANLLAEFIPCPVILLPL